jgi:shikimate dehydrogenase
MEHDEVSLVSGRSRLYGIVGHPITQVRSPEMVTAEFAKRGHHGIFVPFHVEPDDFEASTRALLRMPNLDGLVFTIPYKQRAMALATRIEPNAQTVGAINALARDGEDGWRGEIFDGLGCVEGFRKRGIGFAGKRVSLIGAGGAGSAIAVAIAHEKPASMRLFDLNTRRVEDLAARVRHLAVEVEVGMPVIGDCDILLNATPTGMLDDQRSPVSAERLPSSLVVFDAIVMPETTPLLALAEACGCVTVRGREMMRGQIARIVDFFGV